MTPSEAVRDVLLGIEAAFDAAARRRVGIVRRLSAVELEGADAAARGALSEALLRREAADRDAAAPLGERARRAAGEARAADEARGRLAHRDDVRRLLDAYDATWAQALEASERLAGSLRGRAPEAVAAGVAAYVAAVRCLHDAGADDPPALDAAVAALLDRTSELETAIRSAAPSAG